MEGLVCKCSSKDEKKKGKNIEDEKSKPRVIILSCIYSDQNDCSYILERDLEEILYTIGVHLSRAQVRKPFRRLSPETVGVTGSL
ncbi:cell division cycle and apoptosis regulator protein 1-like [Lytechinus pictus]|uniref:cell division cycle and apoptosis regulator protein 1-like n=1 Tax=Lytechinus pictus TaxID=7653 RepID=UPI0030BA0E60